jgi:GH15 family glucan-1,4-alpha-glucosidase
MNEPSRIEDLGFLSNCRSAAMVDRYGSIVWWCPERFDSDSWFGSLIGSTAGRWTLEPVTPAEVRRRYLPGTLILETTFTSSGGTLRLTDALVFRSGARGRSVGVASPSVLARRVQCVAGKIEVHHVFDPRPHYGAVGVDLSIADTSVTGADDGRTIVLEGGHGLRLVERSHAEGSLRLTEGDDRSLVCSVLPSGRDPERLAACELIEDTALAWRSWNAFDEIPGGPDGLVARSAIVLKGLTHADTGALVASPTTSLPEIVGEGANWDYRYGWLRDSSLSVNALLGTSCSSEVAAYFAWMKDVAFDPDAGGETQAVYGIGGERELPEITLDHLEGYRLSSPVRVGNAAYRQRQLDAYGHVLDAAAVLRRHTPLDDNLHDFLAQLAIRAASNWRRPDHGLWERREKPRRYSSSALMCWVAVTRAIELAECGSPGERLRWAAAKDELGAFLWGLWDEQRQVFPSYPGTSELDASALLFVLTGFVAADDPRAAALTANLEAHLGHDGILRRWSEADDGAFLLCSCWLVEALILTGQVGRAADILQRLASYANDLGLLPEEIEIETGNPLGNTPLAISHAGYICASLMLEEAQAPVHDGISSSATERAS